MTIQFHFFSTAEDAFTIGEVALATLGPICTLPGRAPLDSMVPKTIKDPSEFITCLSEGIHYLIPESEIRNAIYEPIPSGLQCVRFREFPCLEYDSSRISTDGILQSGRFAYFYAGESDFKRLVQQLFRKLRSRAKRLPHKSTCWMFEDAAARAPRLGYSIHTVKPNPYFVHPDE